MSIFLTIERPNTTGITYSRVFESYPEDWIERKCERLADHGWHLSEAWGSTSKHGLIEATHELAVFKDISPDVMRAIVAVKRSTDRLHLEKARHFGTNEEVLEGV